MRLTIDTERETLTVGREPGDPAIRRARQAYGAFIDPDSNFWNYLLAALKSEGDPLGPLIKKRMAGDGHLMGDDMSQYLRPPVKQFRSGKGYMIYNGNWQVQDSYRAYNRGQVTLHLQRLEENNA